MAQILGKKLGMSQFIAEGGNLVGVTVIEAGPCPILAVKQKSLQLGFDLAREKSVKKPVLEYFKKLNIAPRKLIKEVLRESSVEYTVGQELKADIFKNGDFIDVVGTSKGKGFQGGMKRWHWQGGPASHGSTSHRRIGSLGSSTTPGRVWPGHHLPGHMGDCQATIQNLRIVKVDLENNLLLVRGAVPGCKNSYVVIRNAKKKKSQAAGTTTAKPKSKA